LILNCGSSSIKFQIARMPKYNVLVQGRVERIGYDDAKLRAMSPIKNDEDLKKN
jgi:acetate kinase